MKKGKSITLLSIVCLIMAFLIVMTFVRFPIGVKNYNSVLGAIELDYDIAGGTAYDVPLAKDNITDIDDPQDVVDVLEARLDALGYITYSVKAIRSEGQSDEQYSFRVELRGNINEYNELDTSSVDADIETIFSYGTLKLEGGVSSSDLVEIAVDFKAVESASYAGYNSNSQKYLIEVKFADEAYDEIMSGINSNTSYYLKISLGDETLLDSSSAITADVFSGNSVYIQSSSEDSARRTALLISSGGLEYKFDIPTKGNDIGSPIADNIPCIATISICALLVVLIIALVVLFRGLGISLALSSILSMLIEVIMLIAIPGIKLSLGGIFGIIATIVLLFDGQLVLAKRIKEGFLTGKTVKSAIKNGYERALVPTISLCAISGIIALAIFVFASGSLKCFGITFGIGAIISLISNLLFNRVFNSLLLPLFNNKECFLGIRKNEGEAN